MRNRIQNKKLENQKHKFNNKHGVTKKLQKRYNFFIFHPNFKTVFTHNILCENFWYLLECLEKVMQYNFHSGEI